MHPFPFVLDKDKKPEDGLVIAAPGFCSRTDRNVCSAHYSKIRGLPGLHQCPYGYSSYVPKDINHEIFTGLRIEGFYDRAKLKSRKEEGSFSPPIPRGSFDKIIVGLCEKMKAVRDFLDIGKELKLVQIKHDQATEDAIALAHDIRNLNRDIKSAAEDINRMLEGKVDPVRLEDLGQTIFALSSLVSTRITAVELSSFSSPVIKQTRKSQPVHNKFFKAQKCLAGWASKQSQKEIILIGVSFVELDMLPIFDLLPFILLENAIKYSPPFGKIYIQFEESDSHLHVKVKSIGPLVDSTEIARLGKERFRAKYALKADTTGSGRGLELASQIANLHDVTIHFRSSNDSQSINGILYSEFEVRLTADKDKFAASLKK